MPLANWTAVKALFETGDTPTQQNYSDVWDFVSNLIQETRDIADEATAAVASRVLLKAKWTGSAWTIISSSNVTSLTSGTVNQVQVNFTTPLGSTNFYPVANCDWTFAVITAVNFIGSTSTSTSFPAPVRVTTPASDSVLLKFPTVPTNGILYLAIF
jgi:hypothetical protein